MEEKIRMRKILSKDLAIFRINHKEKNDYIVRTEDIFKNKFTRKYERRIIALSWC